MTIEPGRYPCFRVITRGQHKDATSDAFTTEEAALEWAEKEKARVDRYNGPYYSHPWVWTNRLQDIGTQEDLVVGWVSGSNFVHDTVKVVRDVLVVR